MELLFNELSIQPLAPDNYTANDRMKIFSEAVGEARKKGFRNIRSHYFANQIELSPNYTLYDWLNSKEVSEIYRNFLYGMIIPPFIREGDEAIESEYVNANYFFEDTESKIAKTECIGLASAYLYEMPSVSFTSHPVWQKRILQIIIESVGESRKEEVFNITTKTSFDDGEIAAFVESLVEITLDETTIAPDDKKYHISSHHGEKELKDFWGKLKRSPYVVEMRSTNWGGKRFIRNIGKTGVLEIVLVDTEKQYAMWIQTTGKNLRETKAIAEILQAEFS